MGLNTFLGGLALAYQGARDGQQANIDREQAEKDRAFKEQQRGVLHQQQEFQLGQQRRTSNEQQRADTLRGDLASVKPAGTTEVIAPNADVAQITHDDNAAGDEGGPAAAQMPVTKTRTQDQELREIASAYRKAGDAGKAIELENAATKIQFGRAATQFNQVLAGADKMPLPDLARQLASVYDSDPTNGGVKSIEEIPGGVRVTVANKDTGASAVREYVGDAGKQQLLRAFQAYYTPETFAKMQEQTAKAHAELIKNPVASVPNGYYDKVQGRFVQTKADTGHGAGAGAGKLPKPELDQALSMWSETATKGENKLTSEQIAVGRDYVSRLMTENNDSATGSKLPPAMAVRLAQKIAADPTVIKPEINVKTGVIDNMVTDDQTGEKFTIRRGLGDALHPPAGMKPEDISAKTGDMLSHLEQQMPGAKSMYTKGAFSDAGRAEFDGWYRGQVRKAMEAVPGFDKLAPEKQAEAVEKAFVVDAPNLQNRLNLVKNFTAPPAAENKGNGARRRIEEPRGMTAPPGSDQARWNARQEQLRADTAAKDAATVEKRAQVSAQYQADKKSMSPVDLVRKYDGQRSSLPTADAADLFALERTLR